MKRGNNYEEKRNNTLIIANARMTGQVIETRELINGRYVTVLMSKTDFEAINKPKPTINSSSFLGGLLSARL